MITTACPSALQWHRRFLQVLQWKAPGQRWVLKSPQHMWHLQHIHREYPDALFVQTHRDPVRILVSMSNLAATLRRLGSDEVDLPQIAAYYARALANAYNNTVTYRQSGLLPPDQVIDLYFKDFVADQVGTVRKAYEHFGLELPERAAQSMQSFLRDNPSGKHGKHVYKLADTGMEEGYLRELFSPYQAYFNIPAEAV